MANQENVGVDSAVSNSVFSVLFALAFRPLFLAGAAFAVLSIALWLALFTGKVSVDVYGGMLWWHQHEMLFGFASAIVAGFLLTAVQTWTGQRSVHGVLLAALVSLWLLARVLMLFGSTVPLWLMVSVDLAFLPLVALFLGRLIIRVRLWRNLMFVPILLIMAYANAVMHCAAALNSAPHLSAASNTMLLLVSLLMCVIGGRVFPMFTANATKTNKVQPLRWLELLSIAPVVVLTLQYLGLFSLPHAYIAALFLWAGLLNSLRCLRWKIWLTGKTPLLWSLHLSYLAMAFAFILLGLNYYLELPYRSLAVHGLTVGGMAFMILSMIARVSLGHTGRPIKVGLLMTVSFVFMLFAYLARAWLPMVLDDYMALIWVSGVCWIIAFTLFVVKYLPVLSQARVDGKDG
ncbi:NnrS family protein [Agaribacterium sp. ZY112]|uniref:NnrS family protein n=1 Tax=Agaribacterium sp. ZY112 TaxID=3233574 RepID=UPI003525C7AF